MDNYKLWIVVGGTGRKIGKTTLVETLIKRLCRFGTVVGIKISNIRPDGLAFHGNHEIEKTGAFSIWEETKVSGEKDSQRFLKAGAEKSFYIQTSDAFLEEAFLEIQERLQGNEIVVCESNGLRNIMQPAVFLVVKGEDNPASKGYVGKLLEMADYVVKPMDLEQFDLVADSLSWDESQIKLAIK